MSDQNPPGTPAEGPDPFAELLKGLQEEPAPPAPADVPTVAFPAPAEPVPAFPAAPDVPTVAFPVPGEPTPAYSAAEQPTVVFPAPEPVPAAGTPSAGEVPPTVVLPGTFDPTAATTVLAGGGGAGLPPQEPPTGGGGFRDWDPRRKALFITLISAAGVLLIALVILLVVLLSPKGDGPGPDPDPSPSRSSTPTPTPTRSSSPTPTPTPAVKPAVQSFTVNSNTAQCADTGAGTVVTMHFAWTVVGATQIAIGSGPAAIDAIANPFQNNLPETATDFQMPFACSNGQLTYTLTISGPDGQHYSGVVSVVRQVTPPAPTPDPTITSFNVTYDSAFDACTSDPASFVNPTFTWVTANSTEVAIAVDRLTNAFDGAYANGLPSSGNATMPFDCTFDERDYTVSAKNAAGKVVTQYITVFNPADPGGDGPDA